ncbi:MULTISPECIES: phospho-N-acetylmuramoyl-pentapeptide-transferase [Kribbella]|uniref:Phospho-N-acetylmuramoyl-pentapeptide-transferase n=1 Tax=Kribbella pratensis TaxID=2512112 RepID=A0ABY2FLP0_9ACTN|nr:MULTISPECIES: phospho-N-acetylmuramoyl-pentapeptide-transferase [Kribbella]TDW94053.1 phospho-N-acetylmuramoyl-pentapeptide-transferase [Kribbella pratensis]TDX02660.1 phospho-N-acetylmuramoyl-pentapeptide-transferase [Kribbella sp. VKM Ac-2566]
MISILFGGAVAMVLTLLGTRYAIKWLASRGYGQEIRDDGLKSHQVKRGTPTMGGTVFIAATIVGYFAAKLFTMTPPSASAILVLFLFAGMGAVGFVDDFIKIFRQRSLGLRSKAKLAGQTMVAVVFAVLALQFPDDRGQRPASPFISFIRDIGWLELPLIVVVIWILLLIAGMSNGVNLADGLDGLATGASMMVFGAYTLICIWQFGQSCQTAPGTKCYEVRDPHDLAVVAACLTGALFGFLWWNASPAKIFMGDTGSLSLGGALAGMAVMTRTELLVLLLGGLFVLITASVILQVGYFKITKRTAGVGKRLFRMAPLQHHFEMLGWEQVNVVIRFWIIQGLFVVIGLGVFYAEWVTG